MYDILLSFITAFILSYFIIPIVIHIAKEKHLCDEPGERRSHTETTPSLGGIAIFSGIIFSVVFWTPFNLLGDLQYMLCAFIVIFLVGAKDDIVPMAPYKKLIGEIVAACILVFKAGIRISSLYGFFGIHDIPYVASVFLTIFTIIVIINSFNLIDGINGLSGTISVIISISLGIWFFLVDRNGLAILAFSVAGAVVAFLRYNYTPAKIFMGDTGSLLLGLITSILIIQFIEINKQIIPDHPFCIGAAPAVSIGILILPLFDTARVFALRISDGKSPFQPDRRHLHHLLLDYGMTHMQATATLVIASLAFMFFAFTFQEILGNVWLLTAILSIALIMSYTLQNVVEQKQAQKRGLA